jgi:pimeloyl-ACP methyl ester carboxylesterase
MRLPLALALALALALPALVPTTHAGATATEVFLAVDGETAHGYQALPSGACKGVVVIAHGYGHQAVDHVGHLEHLADEGYAAIAMDYRGPQAGFPLGAGADDTVAAANAIRAECPTGDATLFSVSMGTAVAGPVLARMPGFFQQWVDSEGLSMLAETWAEATALAPANAFAKTASDAIASECGGTPATQPECYQERSAALRAGEFVGLRGVVFVHDVNDGLVPYDQGREMQAAVRAIGVPSDFITVLRGNAGDEGTTATGYAGVNVDGLAGHGNESRDADTMTRVSLQALDDVLSGALVPAGREWVVDRDLGTTVL